MMRSELAQTDGHLWNAYQLLIKGHAIYLPHFLCGKEDFTLMKNLSNDLQSNAGEAMTNWSQHLKHENPDFSPTFQEIVKRMADYFDVDVFATRLNFYPDSASWKPFHHDSHAYGGRQQREDFTMGASFGATRELVFLHQPSQQQFSFPQENGDIFAFSTQVNQQFMHGVPKSSIKGPAPRFSIIAWGCRRSLNERNASIDEIGSRESYSNELIEEKKYDAKAAPEKEKEKEQAMAIEEVTELVDKFILNNSKPAPAAAKKPARKSRVQGGWAR